MRGFAIKKTSSQGRHLFKCFVYYLFLQMLDFIRNLQKTFVPIINSPKNQSKTEFPFVPNQLK